MTIRRTLAAVLAGAALLAPAAAQAEPIDMHSSYYTAPAQEKQDLRSPDARDAGIRLHRSDRTVAARPHGTEPAIGQPTWPAHPTTIAAPAAADQPASDGGPSVPVLPLVAGVLAVLIAALAAFYGMRRRERLAASA
jgi:hypothetical protein